MVCVRAYMGLDIGLGYRLLLWLCFGFSFLYLDYTVRAGSLGGGSRWKFRRLSHVTD